MKNTFHVLIFTLFPLLLFGQWSQLGSSISGEVADDNFGWNSSMNAAGDVFVAGSYRNSENGYFAGSARVFEWDGNDWVQRGADIDGEADSWSAWEVAIDASGNTVAVTSLIADNSEGLPSGTVQVYDWDGSNWKKRGDAIEGQGNPLGFLDWFGASLSLSADGNILAIGGPLEDGTDFNAGHVRVHQWNGSDWVQLGGDIDGDVARDEFGFSVHLNDSGDILAVGAIGAEGFGGNEQGYVKVFKWNGTEWIQRGSTLFGEVNGDEFGRSISLDATGHVLAIGASGYVVPDNPECTAYVYLWDGSDWVQRGSTLTGDEDFDNFGEAVSLSANGNILAIGGAVFFSTGHVWIYEWTGTDWLLQQKIAGENTSDIFGASVSLNDAGNTLVVGAWGNGDNGQISIFQNPSIVSSTQDSDRIDLADISAYPNPTTNNLHLKASKNIEQIEIQTLSGQRINSIPGIGGEQIVDLSNLSSGCYLLRIHFQKKIETLKIIKM